MDKEDPWHLEMKRRWVEQCNFYIQDSRLGRICRVNAVSPGAVRTEMLRGVHGGEQALDHLAGVHGSV